MASLEQVRDRGQGEDGREGAAVGKLAHATARHRRSGGGEVPSFTRRVAVRSTPPNRASRGDAPTAQAARMGVEAREAPPVRGRGVVASKDGGKCYFVRDRMSEEKRASAGTVFTFGFSCGVYFFSSGWGPRGGVVGVAPGSNAIRGRWRVSVRVASPRRYRSEDVRHLIGLPREPRSALTDCAARRSRSLSSSRGVSRVLVSACDHARRTITPPGLLLRVHGVKVRLAVPSVPDRTLGE